MIKSSSGNDRRVACLSGQDEGLGIVDSGDTLRDGYRRHERRTGRKLLRQDGAAGVVRRDIDFRKSYTLRFTNKGVGLDLRPKN